MDITISSKMHLALLLDLGMTTPRPSSGWTNKQRMHILDQLDDVNYCCYFWLALLRFLLWW